MLLSDLHRITISLCRLLYKYYATGNIDGKNVDIGEQKRRICGSHAGNEITVSAYKPELLLKLLLRFSFPFFWVSHSNFQPN